MSHKIKLFFLFDHIQGTPDQTPFCISTGIDSDLLKWAFSQGLFQWSSDQVADWHSPVRRSLLMLDEFRLSRSTRRQLNRSNFDIRLNYQSNMVLEACIRKKLIMHGDTWMTVEYASSIKHLFSTGIAHTVSAWRNGSLVGGLIGINIGRFFSAESMFYEETGASLACLSWLVTYLKSEGYTFIDTQVSSDVVERLGAGEINRKEFYLLLDSAKNLSPASFSVL